jgi:hypothetical protein
MRFLVSFNHLEQPGGSQVYALTVAEQLERLGHDAILVTWQEGEMSTEARARGLRVIAPEAVVAGDAEAIVASDAATLLALAERDPPAVRIMVMHSSEYILQTPPQLPGACQAIVVLNENIRRRAEALAVSVPIVRLRQPVDLERYRRLTPPRRPPRRMLIFGNLPRGPRPDSMSEACRAAGLEPVVVGGPGLTTTKPEQALDEADAVLGIGRCALEGLAARRPVYVAGPAGADGWIRAENFTALEADGFSGRGALRRDGSPNLADDFVCAPEPEEVQILYERVVREHDAGVHAEDLVALARQLGPPDGPCPGPLAEMARLVRLELSAHKRAAAAERAIRTRTGRERALQEANEKLRAANNELRDANKNLRDANKNLRDAKGAMLRSRRYRLMTLVLRPVDRLRGHSKGERN